MLVVAIGVGLAMWIGESVTGAALACLVGMAAFALARGFEPTARTPLTPPSDDGGLPAITDLLDAVGSPLMVVRDRRILLANESARTLLGDHIEGGDVRLAIRHPAAAQKFSEPDGIKPGQIELMGLGDVDSHWAMEISPLPNAGALIRLTDLSPARAVEQMRADFVANASHELRTPLATLLGFLETLEDEEAAGDAETRKRFLGIMSEEAKRMRNLVEDLMSLSRIEADRFSPPRDPIALRPLLDSVVDACRTMSQTNGSPLVLEGELEDSIVSGDRAQLAQLFNNLVSNALKYGRPGTPVRIGVDRTGSLVRVSVTDEGEGISPEHIPRLTERFYRVDPGRSRAGGGTGLGLAIAKHIAQRHRGRLEIVSALGKGTTVAVYLPQLDPSAIPSLSSNRHTFVTEDSPSEPRGE